MFLQVSHPACNEYNLDTQFISTWNLINVILAEAHCLLSTYMMAMLNMLGPIP